MNTSTRSVDAILPYAVALLASCTAVRSPSLPPGTKEAHVYVLSSTCLGVLTHVAVLIEDFDAPCPHRWTQFGFGDTTFMSGSAPWNYAYVPVLLLHNLIAPTQGALERLPVHVKLRGVPDPAERERRVAQVTRMHTIELVVAESRAREVKIWLETGHKLSAQRGAPCGHVEEAWSSYSIYHNSCGDFVARTLFLLGVEIDPDRYLPRWLFWYRAN